MQILIADDDRTIRQLLQFQLEQWGHTVLVAEDGVEAWELFQAHDCSIVITDWMMPRMAGVDLIRKIREAARPNYTYVILLTSKSQKDDLIAGLASGADDFLVKPVDPNELQARLKTGLRVSGLRPQNTADDELFHEKQDTEQLLRQNSQCYRGVLATVPDLIFIVLSDGLIVGCCGGQHSFEKSQTESLVGANLQDFINAEKRSELLGIFQDVLTKGDSQLTEFQLQLGERCHDVQAHLTSYDSASVVVILRDLTPHKQAAALLGQLTRRETQVLNAVVVGKPNKQIAQELDLSMKTIECHRSQLMRKLKARSSADLVRVALAAGEKS